MTLPEAVELAENTSRRGVACEEDGSQRVAYIIFDGRCWERDGDFLVPASPDNGLLMADCWMATDAI